MTNNYFPGRADDARVPAIRHVRYPELVLPYFESVQAGFPSPADDHAMEALNLHDYLVKDSACTFFVRVEGESMVGAGIYPDDILVVDRSVEARHNDVVVAFINQQFTVKRFSRRAEGILLLAENPSFAPIEVHPGDELIIWGVVGHVLHRPVKLA